MKMKMKMIMTTTMIVIDDNHLGKHTQVWMNLEC